MYQTCFEVWYCRLAICGGTLCCVAHRGRVWRDKRQTDRLLLPKSSANRGVRGGYCRNARTHLES